MNVSFEFGAQSSGCLQRSRTATSTAALDPSRIGAWASQQSESIADRKALEAARAEVEARFPGDVPRPPHWGGYRLVADAIEFWQGRPGRLHDRIRCTRQGESWIQERLQP